MAQITSVEQAQAAFSAEKIAVVHVWASWAAPCQQIDAVLAASAQKHASAPVAFFRLEAESLPSVTENLKITSVPTVLFLRLSKELDRVVGADVPAIVARIDKFAAAGANAVSADGSSGQEIVLPPAAGSSSSTSKPASISSSAAAPAVAAAAGGDAHHQASLFSRLSKLVRSKPIMLFMKGTPEMPQCGFSRTAVQLLRDNGCESFGSFDILSDADVRQGLKEFSNWPTYPQLYIDGQLIGGLDIMKDLAEQGELKSALEGAGKDLKDKLQKLTTQSRVVLFMKGTPDAPRCGFSRTIVGLLRENNADFSHFDVLEDPEVREGLKEFSNWPTFPQLYVGGKLIGGLDVVKELAEEGELKSVLE